MTSGRTVDDQVSEMPSDDQLADLDGYPGDLRHYWHPIARSDEVVEQPRQFTLLSEKLVVYRDAEGVIAFKDLCIHRGTRLSLGKVTPDGQLQCAYHGWEYDRTGACTRIPARPDDAPIPGKANAIAYSAAEAYGLVWVAMKDPIYPIPEFPNNEFHDPAWRKFLAIEDTWASSAGRILENYCDWSHIPYVHDGVLGTSDRPKPSIEPTPVWEDENRLGYSYEQIDLSFLGGGAQSIRREFVVYLPFFPHLYKVRPNGDTILLSAALSPREPKSTTMYMWILRNYDLDGDDEFYQDYIDVPVAQDRAVVESQRPEEIPANLRDELHIRLPDAFSIEYRKVLQRIARETAHLE